MKSLSWNSVFERFAPFEGTSLYAIRTDAFFHLALESSSRRKFALKNLLYPATIWRRSRKAQELAALPRGNVRYVFTCDYEAEPGFGTLRPLLRRFGNESLLIATDAVARERAAEVQSFGAELINLDAGAYAAARGRFAELWERAGHELEQLLASQQTAMRDTFLRSRRVLKTLLVKSYVYREVYRRCFTSLPGLSGVITHNDFTASSYLACAAAREAGVTSFTLQHGFPTDEYFPISADHYLVWGERFRDVMAAKGARTGALSITGAPRLDGLAAQRAQIDSQGDGGRVLFLSQSHSPLFTHDEHTKILSFLAPVASDPWWKLSVRLHPQEEEAGFRHLSGLGKTSIAPKDVPLMEALKNADLVLACNSTAMLEAMALGVPVVQIAPKEVQDRTGIVAACRRAETPEQLRQVLISLVDPGSRRKLIAEQDQLLGSYLANFGSATDAAARLIRELTTVQSTDAMEARA
ncbi:MAG TPA: DUF6716 putative glycosyltransferase [Candidatus Limnocylindrales bacterium]|nr:DUF6716 putative glycosyltransferase [Candidatus Limnocylindrales bacterium]